MKGRQSGMPDEAFWESFFDADRIVERLVGRAGGAGGIVEFGCGYGTFTLPAAKRTAGRLHTFDIESEMVERVRRRAEAAGLGNVRAESRDFVADGTGLPDGSADHAMIYNLLHLEDPAGLLAEAYRILRPGGIVSILHWRCDVETPRGPSLDIRPRPDQCRAWAEAAGFRFLEYVDLSGCGDFHYGLVAERPS